MVRTYFVSMIMAIGLLALVACTHQGGADTTNRTIVYRVSGTAKEVAITYGNLQRGSEQRTVVVPWEQTFTTSDPRLAWVTARNTGREGTIRCEIVINGEVTSQAQSEGPFKVVSCGSPTRE